MCCIGVSGAGRLVGRLSRLNGGCGHRLNQTLLSEYATFASSFHAIEGELPAEQVVPVTKT